MVPSSDLASIITRAEQEKDSTQASALYQQALELLQRQISGRNPGAEQDRLIQQFKTVLVKAETLKQPAQPQSQYQQLKQQAKTLAEQAVAADGRGELADAYQQYCQLLDVLNQCHTLETESPVRTGIMNRFQVGYDSHSRLSDRYGQLHTARSFATVSRSIWDGDRSHSVQPRFEDAEPFESLKLHGTVPATPSCSQMAVMVLYPCAGDCVPSNT